MTGMVLRPPERVERRWLRFLPAALVVHVLILASMAFSASMLPPPRVKHPPLSLVILQPNRPAPEVEPEPEPEVDLTGQIVDVAPPLEEEIPKEARFLAEHSQVVPEETRSERFLVNPEVLSPVFSEEASIRAEAVEDVNVTEDSTGATVGHDAFDPARDGRLAALPAEWTKTNREGLQAPRLASHTQQELAGSPSNDRLDVKRGVATQLNTKEFLYAAYLNRIRRLVSYFWNQNLSNLPHSVRLSQPEYTTAVLAVLDNQGRLSAIHVSLSAGIVALDEAVVNAFRAAGPFPEPPDGLVDADGLVRLPLMQFTVNVGRADNPYQGVDPRAGVQFPGILKAPR